MDLRPDDILASGENEDKVIRIQEQDTFIMAYPPSDRNEVVATSTIDELYKSGCHVKYVTRKDLAKMHAYEEDLKMVLSLLKPKFYLPIQGYYVNLLSNAIKFTKDGSVELKVTATVSGSLCILI